MLDEPTSALDPVVEQEIVTSIRTRLARCVLIESTAAIHVRML